MWFEQVLFFVAAIGALGGALGVVILRNPFYSVLALVAHLRGAGDALPAPARRVPRRRAGGGVRRRRDGALRVRGGLHRRLRRAAAPRGRRARDVRPAVRGGDRDRALHRAPRHRPRGGGHARGRRRRPASARPGQIGSLLLRKFLVPFEAASYLLLVAAVGAVVLAGRRRGLEDASRTPRSR